MPKALKKEIWLKHHISRTEKCCQKAKIAQNNSQASQGGMTGIAVKPGQDSIHEFIWKANPFVASVTCSRYRNSANHPYCFLSNQKKVQILAFLHVICERNVSCPPSENRLGTFSTDGFQDGYGNRK